MNFHTFFIWLRRKMLAKKRTQDYRIYLEAKRKKEQFVSYEKSFNEYTLSEHLFWILNIPPKTQIITFKGYRKLLLKRYKGLKTC